MVARSYVPDAGHLVWLTFDPQAGHEQRGPRPALILSPRAYNVKARLAIACPITGHAKGYPFEVALPDDGKVTGPDHVAYKPAVPSNAVGTLDGMLVLADGRLLIGTANVYRQIAGATAIFARARAGSSAVGRSLRSNPAGVARSQARAAPNKAIPSPLPGR